MNEDSQRTLSGNFEVALNLTTARQIRMTGYVYSDDTAKDINERIDRFQDALDRQVVRYDIVMKEAEIATAEASIEQLADHHAELMSLEKGTKKLTSQQRMQLTQYEASVRRWKNQKESAEAAIEAARHKLNGAAT